MTRPSLVYFRFLLGSLQPIGIFLVFPLYLPRNQQGQVRSSSFVFYKGKASQMKRFMRKSIMKFQNRGKIIGCAKLVLKSTPTKYEPQRLIFGNSRFITALPLFFLKATSRSGTGTEGATTTRIFRKRFWCFLFSKSRFCCTVTRHSPDRSPKNYLFSTGLFSVGALFQFALRFLGNQKTV